MSGNNNSWILKKNNVLDVSVQYHKNDLKKLLNKDLVDLMNIHSLSYRGMKKRDMIKAILGYQRQRNNIASSLVTNNPIENHHRGIVNYSLPPMVIHLIIKILWCNEIYYYKSMFKCFNPDYKYMLSLSLISKEIFKLISSLLNRLEIPSGIYEPLMTSLINPYCVMKRITHLTICVLDFNIFANEKSKDHKKAMKKTDLKTKSKTLVSAALLFAHVEKLVLLKKKEDSPMTISQAKQIGQHIPHIKSISFKDIEFTNSKSLIEFSQMKSLTSLDFSRCYFKSIKFTSDMVPPNIKKLKLPINNNPKFSYTCSEDALSSLNDRDQLQSIGIALDNPLFYDFIPASTPPNKFKNLVKLTIYIPENYEKSLVVKKLTDLISHQHCTIKHLEMPGLRINKIAVPLLEEALLGNKSITRIGVSDDFKSLYKLAAVSPHIKELISYPPHFSYFSNENTTTGFIKSRSKLLCRSYYGYKNYYKRIFDVLHHTPEENREIEEEYKLQFPKYDFVKL